MVSYRIGSKPPAILQVNQESRLEALKHYQLDFGNSVGHMSLASEPKIYINWNVDRICIMDSHNGEKSNEMVINDFKRRGFEHKLKFLAINTSHSLSRGHFDSVVGRWFSGLEEIVLFSLPMGQNTDTIPSFSSKECEIEFENAEDGVEHLRRDQPCHGMANWNQVTEKVDALQLKLITYAGDLESRSTEVK